MNVKANSPTVVTVVDHIGAKKVKLKRNNPCTETAPQPRQPAAGAAVAQPDRGERRDAGAAPRPSHVVPVVLRAAAAAFASLRRNGTFPLPGQNRIFLLLLYGLLTPLAGLFTGSLGHLLSS